MRKKLSKSGRLSCWSRCKCDPEWREWRTRSSGSLQHVAQSKEGIARALGNRAQTGHQRRPVSSSDGTVLESLLHSVIGWGSCRNGFQNKTAGALQAIKCPVLRDLEAHSHGHNKWYHEDELANSQESN